jgi:hypothetical protein
LRHGIVLWRKPLLYRPGAIAGSPAKVLLKVAMEQTGGILSPGNQVRIFPEFEV